ncbi:aldo/keto reductase family oxidoreductase [Flaviflexus salsibiostraticola]|uniref:Aldo/keto reductase family oxidoreductase n=1 Tax=Flaviflexus salsibiostraticola TaxID=1282737 RepID=A0A3S8Z9K5_9ACTO|nr:aldo/keto reductase [Flaviflexus salsibiostraticola]AZN30207.1 aldo/keto reductase family oxidoreductase [Flaviflexus salsibiostraticola]
MKTIHMRHADLQVPNMALGLLRIADLSDDEVRALVTSARDAGIDYFDHADIYGTRLHECEERFARALRLSSSERDRITLQTKVGIVPDGGYYDHSYDHLITQVEGSLRALGTDRIDMLLLHRPDALVEPEEVARAFDELYSSGKVRHFGVSNHTPGQIDLLKTAVTRPIVANQVQLSITHSPIIAQGIAANTPDSDQAAVRDGGGLIDYCRINGITIQAWSPFKSGSGESVLFDRGRHPELTERIDALAAQYGVEPEAIAAAWITRHPADMQVILGTTRPARVRAAAAGSDLPLTRAEWYGLFSAAGWHVP